MLRAQDRRVVLEGARRHGRSCGCHARSHTPEKRQGLGMGAWHPRVSLARRPGALMVENPF